MNIDDKTLEMLRTIAEEAAVRNTDIKRRAYQLFGTGAVVFRSSEATSYDENGEYSFPVSFVCREGSKIILSISGERVYIDTHHQSLLNAEPLDPHSELYHWYIIVENLIKEL